MRSAWALSMCSVGSSRSTIGASESQARARLSLCASPSDKRSCVIQASRPPPAEDAPVEFDRPSASQQSASSLFRGKEVLAHGVGEYRRIVQAQMSDRLPVGGHSVDEDAPSVGRKPAGDLLQQGRLAGTARPRQHARPALPAFEADRAAQRPAVGRRARQVVDRQALRGSCNALRRRSRFRTVPSPCHLRRLASAASFRTWPAATRDKPGRAFPEREPAEGDEGGRQQGVAAHARLPAAKKHAQGRRTARPSAERSRSAPAGRGMRCWRFSARSRAARTRHAGSEATGPRPSAARPRTVPCRMRRRRRAAASARPASHGGAARTCVR